MVDAIQRWRHKWSVQCEQGARGWRIQVGVQFQDQLARCDFMRWATSPPRQGAPTGDIGLNGDGEA